ncbi:hypothetical protein ARALYDRAFT_355500 [Arabidopsis lyrata subsp. lyrata]|uniref:DUF1985 domain-containing protein n=1 Tax=Arabidopsis lyrata subsp. lyrata TaxID=81972 RepID=D7MHL9_ARALL|nr:hypothetical protein ARALYDRAFT_355500 [Arabidopsis lyrata subsp. lyrata]
MKDYRLSNKFVIECYNRFMWFKQSLEKLNLMESRIPKRNYPPRLYREGKSQLQTRSMHHNCTLAIESGYEMWSLIERYPVRFSLHEFSEITGLNYDAIDEEDKVDDHREFWAELEVDAMFLLWGRSMFVVQYMVVKSEEELYPTWSNEKVIYGEVEGSWELLDNLMHDILLDRVDEKEVQILKISHNEKKYDEEGSVNKSVYLGVKETVSAALPINKSVLHKSMTPKSTGPHSSVKKKCIKTEPIDPLESLSPVRNPKTSPVVDFTELSEGSDSIENARDNAFDGAVDKLLLLCKKDDFVSQVPRQKNFASAQVHPFVGSSLVKGILRGKKQSLTIYDPLEKATQLLVDMLLAIIHHDL